MKEAWQKCCKTCDEILGRSRLRLWCENPNAPYVLMGTLAAINIFYIFWVRVFPFQDLPQHLAYARVIADYNKSGNLFSQFYNLSSNFNSYHTYHWLLSIIGKVVGIEFGNRLFLLLYLVLMGWGISFLMDSLDENLKSSPWKKLIIQLSVWNASVILGFMPTIISMPFFPLAIGGFLRLIQKRGNVRSNWAIFSLALLLLSLTHILTLLAVILFFIFFSLFHRKSKSVYLCLGTLLFTLIATRWYGGLGDGGLLDRANIDWDGAFVHSYDFEFMSALFNVTWSTLPILFNYFSWNFVGVYRLNTLVPLIFLYLVVLGLLEFWAKSIFFVPETNPAPVSKKSKKNAKGSEDDRTEDLVEISRRAFLSATKLFFAIALLLPWGISNPMEVSFINFRMITLAFFLVLGLWPSRWVSDYKQRLLIVFVVFLSTGIFNYKTYMFQKEAAPPMRLIERIPTNQILGSLIFGNKSEYFGKIFDVAHYLPMYYTVRSAGINAQFWACYAPHLPVCYRPGMRITSTDDWHPWKFSDLDLKEVDYLLFSTMYYDNNPVETEIKRTIHQKMDVVECENGWCLYRKKIN